MLAKADTMTPEEVAHFKKQIMNQIVQSKIKGGRVSGRRRNALVS